MTSWVLIVIFSLNQPTIPSLNQMTIPGVYFQNKDMCEAAETQIVKDISVRLGAVISHHCFLARIEK